MVLYAYSNKNIKTSGHYSKTWFSIYIYIATTHKNTYKNVRALLKNIVLYTYSNKNINNHKDVRALVKKIVLNAYSSKNSKTQKTNKKQIKT